jgi:hypothetical protein
MKVSLNLFALCFSIFLVACTHQPRVNTDYQVGYDFAKLKTFQVMESKQDTKMDVLVSPFTLGHIHQALETELTKR